MAYFAGNAFYIAHTNKHYESYSDYRHMCGAGVHINENLFEGNIGLKKHNGGAIKNVCITEADPTAGFYLYN